MSEDKAIAREMDKFRRRLVKRTPGEWQAAVRSLQCRPQCKTMAACIVWWDFFSEREPPAEVAALDKARRDWDYMVLTHRRITVRPATLAKAMVALGYHPAMADKRSRVVAE